MHVLPDPQEILPKYHLLHVAKVVTCLAVYKPNGFYITLCKKSNWIKVETLVSDDEFGYSLSIDGYTSVVCAWHATVDSITFAGTCYMYMKGIVLLIPQSNRYIKSL